MIADYSSSPQLFKNCINLVEECFPDVGIKAVAIKAIGYNASWPEISTPFIHYRDSLLVGHLGVIQNNLVINGKSIQVAAIHGVCVKEKFRKKGIFTKLMNEALKYIDHHYDGSILFTDKPHYYEKFGFKVVRENDFLINTLRLSDVGSDIRQLNIDSSEDLTLMHHLLSNRCTVSNRLGISNEHVLFTYAALYEPIFYSKKHNLLISYSIEDEILYIKDLVFSSPIPLDTILSLIPETYSKVITQFCPDLLGDINMTAIEPNTECQLMISNHLELGDEIVRFPELARC